VSWYEDAVFYELHLRSFFDANGDGYGDIAGLIDRLDYLQDLGITAIWLLPFFPSPLRDDGYDVADYTDVDPRYGTLDDFRRLVDEAHRRGLRIVTEFILNHTSDQHPWFQRARRAPPGSVARDFYVWSDTSERFRDARIIFTDTETSNWAWDPVAGAWYWHRFFSHQPDLNYDNPAVRRAILDVADFWLDLGVDGLRLDAVPYLYEREGTTCENLPETHAFLKELRAHVDERYGGDRMLLAEANQWPVDAAAYFGDGDECHMNYHFPLMPRLFLALARASREPIEWILARTPPIPPSCRWGTFLRNHDELTLEMVTEEEREAMDAAYASDPRARLNVGIRRRLAPLLDGDERRIRLLFALLLALPGTPFVYYGDEIGMGDDLSLPDRNGLRTPMQWNASPNAGFTTGTPYAPVVDHDRFSYRHVNVAAQRQDPSSLWNWLRGILERRRSATPLLRGTMGWLPAPREVVAFERTLDGDTLLVYANLADRSVDVTVPRAATDVLGSGRLRAGSHRLEPFAVRWLVPAGEADGPTTP